MRTEGDSERRLEFQSLKKGLKTGQCHAEAAEDCSLYNFQQSRCQHDIGSVITSA